MSRSVGQHRLDVLEQMPEERPFRQHPSDHFAPCPRGALRPLPTPYHPGSMCLLWVRKTPRYGAQCTQALPPPHRRTRTDVHALDHVQRRGRTQNSKNCGPRMRAFVSVETADRNVCMAATWAGGAGAWSTCAVANATPRTCARACASRSAATRSFGSRPRLLRKPQHARMAPCGAASTRSSVRPPPARRAAPAMKQGHFDARIAGCSTNWICHLERPARCRDASSLFESEYPMTTCWRLPRAAKCCR